VTRSLRLQPPTAAAFGDVVDPPDASAGAPI